MIGYAHVKCLGGSPGGVRESFLPGGGCAELSLKEKIEISQVKKRGRGILGKWWGTEAKRGACVILCRSPRWPQMDEALRVRWESGVRDEAKEVSEGLAAQNLARDVKELDTNPLGQRCFILTAFENPDRKSVV